MTPQFMRKLGLESAYQKALDFIKETKPSLYYGYTILTPYKGQNTMTTTKNDLLAQQAKLQQELTKLKSQIENLDQSPGVWTPKVNEKYWYLTSYSVEYKDWSGLGTEDKFRLETGNVFKTKEEALKEVERRKVLVKLKELTNGFKPDWSNTSQFKYHLVYSHRDNSWDVEYNYYTQRQGAIYFESMEDAENAIKVLGSFLDVLKG